MYSARSRHPRTREQEHPCHHHARMCEREREREECVRVPRLNSSKCALGRPDRYFLDSITENLETRPTTIVSLCCSRQDMHIPSCSPRRGGGQSTGNTVPIERRTLQCWLAVCDACYYVFYRRPSLHHDLCSLSRKKKKNCLNSRGRCVVYR